MRITNNMMVNKFLTESNAALNRLAKYQSQVDSTKRISSISDDPEATLLALRARNKLSNLDLYNSNIKTASSYLTEAESAVSSLNEVLKSAYETIVSANSGEKTSSELLILAEDIKNLQKEVLSISNTSIGSSYIFGGFNYTGSQSGDVKNPPFTVDNVTGDLSYNGINLSRFSWAGEFKSMTESMAAFKDKVIDLSDDFTAASDEDFAKQKATQALEALRGLISSAENAMTAAREFGVDPGTSTEYQAFKTFYDNISAVADELYQEVSQDLVGDDTGLTPDELENRFSAARALDILDAAVGAGGLLDTPMTDAIAGLQPQVTIDPADEALLVAEAGKKTTLQIGTSQQVDITLTGLELLGTGENNIYHMLGKAAALLEKSAAAQKDGENLPAAYKDELGKMVTSIQNSQSSVITLQTKIGATQNRMDMISERYNSSELNYTAMRSEAEDVDMAEAIMNLTTAKTVYNAALAGGAEILRTSLIDFLR